MDVEVVLLSRLTAVHTYTVVQLLLRGFLSATASVSLQHRRRPRPHFFCSVLCARLPPKLCTTAVVAAATAAIAAGAAAAAVVRASLSAVSDLASQLVAGLGLDVVGPATGRGDERGGGGRRKREKKRKRRTRRRSVLVGCG